MFSKQIVLFLFLCLWMTAVKSSSSLNELLVPGLDFHDVEKLSGPEISKKSLSFEGSDYLFVTRDYGSGLKILEIFLYRNNPKGLDLEFFARTKCQEADATIENKEVKIKCAGKHLFSWKL